MIETEGHLIGKFEGFNNFDTIFEFDNGAKWQQAEYKYHYYYAYRPHAKVIREGGNYFLVVDGLDNKVMVKKVA